MSKNGNVEQNRTISSSKKCRGRNSWNSHLDPGSGQLAYQRVHRPTKTSARGIDSDGSRKCDNTASEPLPQDWL